MLHDNNPPWFNNESGKPLILIQKMIYLNSLLIMENFNSIMVDFNVSILISWNFQFLFSKEKKIILVYHPNYVVHLDLPKLICQ